jgi:hypothetical protein
MKYSEAKKTILKLKAHGWYKEMPGSPHYRKNWRQDNMRYMQALSFNEIIYSLYDLDGIMIKYEEQAVAAFRKHIEETTSIRGGFKRYEI